MRLVSSLLVLAALALSSGCAGDDPSTPQQTETSTSTDGSSSETGTSETGTSETGTETGEPGDADIVELLEAIDGMFVHELQPGANGERVFELGYLQPSDHDDPSAPWFLQKIYLRHRDLAAPMVLFTTGYHLYIGPDYEAEPTLVLAANQIAVEQRFFGDSKPAVLDWSLMTIAQAAADHHRIVEALRPIYAARWLSTGGSKGGMTSVYHRRFYPDDVDATLAYVAPHSFSPRDERYVDFLEQIGDPECAQAMRDFQAIALSRRVTLIPMLAQQAADEGYTFERYGGFERTFEAGVVEVRWSFWQYRGVAYCPDVPGPMASDTDIYEFIDQHLGWDSYDDGNLAQFETYYYQAASELGAPAIVESHLDGLLLHNVDPGWKPLLPAHTNPVHDPAVMADISAWLGSAGERLMFIYGAWDPWSGGNFEADAASANDAPVYWVAQGNHRVRLSSLPDAEYEQAVMTLYQWMDLELDWPDPGAVPRRATQPMPELRGILP